MLKHCVETMFGNKGEGLLQACISSKMYIQLFNAKTFVYFLNSDRHLLHVYCIVLY